MYPYDQFGPQMGYPQMQGGFGGGWPQMGGYGQQMGNGGFGQYQPQATGADQGNARIDKLKGRVSNLQEQMKGAGTQDMAGIQARMDKMQGRIKGLRQDRRQGEGMYGQPAGQQGGAQPEPAMYTGGAPGFYGGGNQMGGAAMYGGQRPMGYGGMPQGFGMNPMQYGGMQGGGMYGGGMGGMGEGAFRGGYNPNQYQSMIGQQPQGANRPGMQYRQDRRQANRQQGGAEQGQMPQQQQAPQQQGGTAAMMPGNGGSWNPLTTPTGMGNVFDTGWGQLVPASGGNSNVFRRADGDDSTLYHFDPNAIGNDGAGAKGGWKSMSQDAYRGYGDYNYADPYNDPRAQARMQNWTKQNGLIQGQVGTGAYK